MKKFQNLWSGMTAPANSTHGEDGASTLQLANGAKFRIQAPPPAITGESVPRQLVRDAVDVLSYVAAQTHGALTNANLSEQGRRNALSSAHGQAVLTTGQLWRSVQGFKQSIEAREQQLYAVAPPNLNQAGAAIRAWECRSHFATLNADQKKAFFDQIKGGGAQVEEIVGALLNSPIAVASEELVTLRELWQQARRDLNPTEAEAIDADKEAAAWAASTISTIAMPIQELMKSVGAPDPVEVFARVSIDPSQVGFEAFGIVPRDMSRAKQIVSFETPLESAE